VLFFIAAMFSSSSTLRAQDSVHEQLFQMMLLEQDGQFSKVIETVPLLLKSTALSQGERGRGWVLLGAAQQTHGDFLQAQIAYDHALQIFSGDHALVDDYAATLENYAGLYRDLWQSQLAIRMERKALTIYESQNNHARLARSCAMLGELELNLDERRKAHDYLFRALNEAKLAGETDGDLVASITSTQAWLSLKDGHSQAAISASEHAVELW
jgi:tetratricopeptide (TPR) repeat protein